MGDHSQPTAPAGSPRANRGRAARYRRLLERAGGMVFELAVDGTAVYVGEGAAPLTGYRPEELVGRPLWAVLCPGEQARQVATLVARVAAGDVNGFELPITARDGRPLLVEVSTANAYGRGGRLDAVVGLAADARQRRRAEDAARQLAAIVESSDDAIVGETLDGLVASWNAGAERVYGYTLAEARGKSVYMLVPPERADELPPLLARLRRGERVEHVETVRVRKDGRRIHVSLTISPIRDAAGRVIGTSTIARDISPRKQAEDQLRLLAHAVESSSELIGITDMQDRFTFLNRAFLAAYGYAEDEIIGQHPSVLASPANPPSLAAEILQLTRCGGWKGELINRRKDGSEFPVQLSTSVIRDGQGKAIGLIYTARDITDRVRAEKAVRASEGRYRLLFERNLAGVIRTTAEGVVLDCNESFAEILGYQSPDEILRDHRVQDFYYDAAERDRLMALLWERHTLLDHEIRFRRKDDSPVWVLANFSLVAGEDGASIVHGTVIDITNRKIAEAKQREYAERLKTLSVRLMETQEIERRHLARELHDEIGQILTAISINLQAVRGHVAPEALPRIEEGIGIVDRAIREVRNLSLDLRPSMLDDLGLAAAVRWYLDRQADRGGFEVHFTSNLTETRMAPDLETACFRVIQEAVTNIIRHAKARHVSVKLNRQGPELRLAIRDDGVGFDPATVRQRASHGRSLGLMGMQERVQIVGGQIDITSRKDHGTTIRVSFPVENR